MPPTNESGHEIYLDPLKEWITKTHELPVLAPLAGRVFAIPASQAQLASCFIATETLGAECRASRDPEELLDCSAGIEEAQSGNCGSQKYFRCSFVRLLTIGPIY